MQKISLAEKIYNRLETSLMEKLVLQERPGPFFKWLFKLPVLQYKLGMGWMIGRYVLLLTTTGRKSGKPRQTALEYIYDQECDRYRVTAGWGGGTDWYRNAMKDPNVTVQVGRRKFRSVAERVCDTEVAEYMMYISARHPRMDRVWSRWSDRPLDGTFESYVYAARFFPSLWLQPTLIIGKV
ncbi:MAG TPA: nitroreductase/quinone reductase family protein [Anaerolineales bacterium]|nr:nitroreductase/quinone reductase family protein [Anaerolineales bacterium]